MTIADWRAEIDAIDHELLRMLNRRATLAMKIGESKRSAGLSLCDRGREREVVSHVFAANRGPLDARALTLIFRRIIRESRRVQADIFGQTGAQAERALR